jgi:hypothetical protein
VKIAVHILCYNVDRFLLHVIANCHPYVDRIYLAWSPLSWGGGSFQKENPTDIYKYNLVPRFPKCEIIEGVWHTETDMRNSCLDKARADGYDWLIIQDADEFYSDAGWILALRALAIAPLSVNLVKTTMFNFWKHPSIIALNRYGGYKTNNPGFALRITPESCFVHMRGTIYADIAEAVLLDVPCYHYGWVLSDQEMKAKLSTWGHANDLDTNLWFRIKWERWNFATRNLNPLYPRAWSKAVLFPGEHQPFALDIFGSDFFLRENSLNNRLHLRVLAEQIFYDAKVHVNDFRTQLSRFRHHANL